MLQAIQARLEPNRPCATVLAEADGISIDPCNHAVQFYEDDAFLVNSVAEFVANGLARGDPVVVVATEKHSVVLTAKLRARGVDVDREERADRLALLDAHETLAVFMERGMPDRERFRAAIGVIVERITRSGTPSRIRAFGEMVDVLWKDGNSAAAIRLEQLWSEIVSVHDLSLLCAYSMGTFPEAKQMSAIKQVCRLHTHVLPTEGFVGSNGAARHVEVVRLQRRARALETEIARRKVLEANLRRAARAAKRASTVAKSANRAKSQFLAVMSHELRTPLNAIGGHAELLEMEIYGPVNEEQRDALVRIQRNHRHLLELINRVLDYARLETGSLRYDIAHIDLDETLSAAEALARPQISAKGLQYTRSGSVALAVRADRAKVHQIVINLLTNATKFTETGGDIAVECAADDVTVFVRVRDTGIGIPAERLGAIFDPFVQVDTTYTRTSDGIGLGLAISWELARGMNGALSVESALGHGSTFTLALPRFVQ